MAELDAHALSLAIRWLHAAAMAVALGGAVLLAVLPRGAGLEAAVRYEWAFWAALGVLAMTGVGNVAALAIGLPPADDAWGRAFVAKLGTVLALAALSVPRTLVVATLAEGPAAATTGTVRTLYRVTSLVLVAVLGLAVWLAHG